MYINNIDLYRDDRLACFKNNNGHQNDKIRKLEIKCNLKSVDYLDINLTLTLDLTGHIENQTMTQDI